MQADNTLGGHFVFTKDEWEWLQMPLKTRNHTRYQASMWHWWVLGDNIRWAATDGLRAHIWEHPVQPGTPERHHEAGSAIPMVSRVYGVSGTDWSAFEVVDGQAEMYKKFRKSIESIVIDKHDKFDEFELRGIDNARDVKGQYRGTTPFLFCLNRDTKMAWFLGESISAKLLPDDKEFFALDGLFFTQAIKGLGFGRKFVRVKDNRDTIFVRCERVEHRWAAIQPIMMDGYLGKWRTA